MKWHHCFHIALAIKLQWWTNKNKWKWAATCEHSNLCVSTHALDFGHIGISCFAYGHKNAKHDNKILPVRGCWILISTMSCYVMRTHAYTSTRMITNFIWVKLSCLRVRSTRIKKKNLILIQYKCDCPLLLYVWVLSFLISKTTINHRNAFAVLQLSD